MTQRNFQNARNMGDGPKGKSKKSAGSAKLKSKAASSVYTPSKEAKAKAKNAKTAGSSKADKPIEKKASDPAEQMRRRERAMVSMMRDMPEYKYWRRIWWVLMGIAFIVIIATWIPNMLISNGILGEDFRETASWISSVGFIFAIVALIGAFYIDFRKIRKLQKMQEHRARNLSKSERKELDAAIARSIENEERRRAEKKSKMPWAKKGAKQDDPKVEDDSEKR